MDGFVLGFITSKCIMQVEAEVSRLEELKSSKMKELVLKKRSELEESCRKTHMVPEVDSTMEDAIEAIESGICLDDCCGLTDTAYTESLDCLYHLPLCRSCGPCLYP